MRKQNRYPREKSADWRLPSSLLCDYLLGIHQILTNQTLWSYFLHLTYLKVDFDDIPVYIAKSFYQIIFLIYYQFNFSLDFTQTLFRVQSMPCFSIVLLAENASFVAVLLSIYMLLILVYPLCTQTKFLSKI